MVTTIFVAKTITIKDTAYNIFVSPVFTIALSELFLLTKLFCSTTSLSYDIAYVEYLFVLNVLIFFESSSCVIVGLFFNIFIIACSSKVQILHFESS